MASLIGKQAPDFRATAVCGKKFIENFDLEQYRGKYVVLFFYPWDFTFVCPTELHAFQEKLAEFEKKNCQVIGCSVDSQFSHFAWLNTPKHKGGIEGVNYPLISDAKKTIAESYGVLKEDEGCSYRGLFLIDKEGTVRHATINDNPIGRSVDEALRVLDAWIHSETYGEVCPANWKAGNISMQPTREGVEKYFAGSVNP